MPDGRCRLRAPRQRRVQRFLCQFERASALGIPMGRRRARHLPVPRPVVHDRHHVDRSAWRAFGGQSGAGFHQRQSRCLVPCGRAGQEPAARRLSVDRHHLAPPADRHAGRLDHAGRRHHPREQRRLVDQGDPARHRDRALRWRPLHADGQREQADQLRQQRRHRDRQPGLAG